MLHFLIVMLVSASHVLVSCAMFDMLAPMSRLTGSITPTCGSFLTHDFDFVLNTRLIEFNCIYFGPGSRAAVSTARGGCADFPADFPADSPADCSAAAVTGHGRRLLLGRSEPGSPQCSHAHSEYVFSEIPS